MAKTGHFILSVDPERPPAGLAGAVVAIGNFDGVHRGHRAVIARAKALARKLGRPCAVLTFEPHPADFFARRSMIFRLTPRDAKAHRLAELGLDGMFVLTFASELAGLDAESFLREILLRRLGARAVVVGYDFHFGAKRSGTPEFLRVRGQELGLTVEIVEKVVADEEGALDAVSSTATREALALGDVAAAAALLGHPWSVTGRVIHGAKLGRTLGYPTANLAVEETCRLRHAIYAVEVQVEAQAETKFEGQVEAQAETKYEGQIEAQAETKYEGQIETQAETKYDGQVEAQTETKYEGQIEAQAETKYEGQVAGKRLKGVASFGRRPTVDNGPPLLETYIFDFDGDLYGKEIEVFFIAFLRGEEKFPSLDALQAQIRRDEAVARRVLGA